MDIIIDINDVGPIISPASMFVSLCVTAITFATFCFFIMMIADHIGNVIASIFVAGSLPLAVYCGYFVISIFFSPAVKPEYLSQVASSSKCISHQVDIWMERSIAPITYHRLDSFKEWCHNPDRENLRLQIEAVKKSE